VESIKPKTVTGTGTGEPNQIPLPLLHTIHFAGSAEII